MPRTKKIMTARKRVAKKPKVSTAIMKYVDKKTKAIRRRGITDDFATESSIGTLSIWYSDAFMNPLDWWDNTNSGASSLKVYSYGLKIKYHIYSNTNETPLAVRMLVVENLRGNCNVNDYRSGSNLFEYNTAVAGTAPAQSINGTTANLTWRINDEFYRVHYDKILNFGTTHDQEPGGRVRNGTVWVPYKKQLKYELNASFPERSNLALLYIPIEAPNDVGLGKNIEITSCASWYYSV